MQTPHKAVVIVLGTWPLESPSSSEISCLNLSGDLDLTNSFSPVPRSLISITLTGGTSESQLNS